MEKVAFIAALLLTVVAVSRGQDGCPPLPARSIGLCAEQCKGDGDCLPGEKCCSNGCGHECKAIVNRCLPVTCDKPGCHVVKADNNCDVCKCDTPTPSCDDTKCPEGYRCILRQVECIRAPCPPIPQCVEIKQLCNNSEPLLTSTGETYYCGRGGARCPDGYSCHIDPADRFAVCCPKKPEIKQLCNNSEPLLTSTGETYYCGRGGARCPDGYSCHIDPADRFAVCCPKKPDCLPVRCAAECRLRKGKDGCAVCDCDDICPVPFCLPSCKTRRGEEGCLECDCDRPCPRIACAPWCRRRKDENGCVVCDCLRPCPRVLCRRGCRVVKDKKGCDACDCQDPCQSVHCEEGQVCEVQTMPCFWPTCPEQAVCVDKPRCPPIRCTPGCRPTKGPDGCDFCTCPSPCHECRPEQTCEIQYPTCRPEQEACPPPIGICKDPPPPPQNRRCMTRPRLTPCLFPSPYRYVYDVSYGRCRRLGRHTCSSSRNRFRTMSECMVCQARPAMVGPPEPVGGRPGDRSVVGG